MYYKKTYYLGDVIEVEKRYPGNHGAPGKNREKKRKATPDDIRRQNEKNKWRKVQRLILANFKEGDWHLILKYRPGDRPEYEDGRKQVKKFLADMRQAYKKAGLQFKYIVVTERGRKGQTVHHHLVIEDIADEKLNTVKLVKQLWGHGNQFFVSLYEDGEYQKLAEYIVKQETKEEKGWASYSRSRNLAVPEPEKETVYRKSWSREPKPVKGYYVVKDSVVNGINPVTGYPYQHYMMRKIAKHHDDD